MCTSLLYRDAAGAAYAGRTMEFIEPVPWRAAYLPAGIRVSSQPAPRRNPLSFTTKHQIFAVTGNVETLGASTVVNSKIVEGMNDAGLSFSLLSYADSAGPAISAKRTIAALSALDLGSRTLGQYLTVEAAKAAIRVQPVILVPVADIFGTTKSPSLRAPRQDRRDHRDRVCRWQADDLRQSGRSHDQRARTLVAPPAKEATTCRI